MTNSHYKAGKYVRQNKVEEKEKGSFCTRVKTYEGTAQPSGVKPVKGPQLDQQPQGTIHRNSVDRITPLEPDHEPFTSVHRPEPADLQQLKTHQQAMLSKRQKTKNRSSKGRQV